MPLAYIDVVLPLALPPLTFSVDGERVPVPGMQVVVRLGRRKLYAGIVWQVRDSRPDLRTIRSVESVEGDAPVVPDYQLRLWAWIADYYMCTVGEVMKAAVPARLKPGGFTREELDAAAYAPRVVPCYALDPAIGSEQRLHEAFESLRRAPRQHAALIDFVERAGADALFRTAVPRPALKADATILRALTDKHILACYLDGSLPDSLTLAGSLALSGPDAPAVPLPDLSAAQRQALAEVDEAFREKDAVLLHGVTGSGKTELYITLIARALAEGRDVLYLLPEIALTAQLIDRLRRYFGARTLVYHSRFTDTRRAACYEEVRRGAPGRLVVGARSALFLPFRQLGLVIVDEEHEGSFKQAEPPPRYHARDCALVLARLCGAPALLGSATPSLESYSNALAGKYGLVELTERYGGAVLPRVVVADTLRAARRGERVSHFTRALLDRLDATLGAGRQAILFQNRRGFSPFVECGTCGWTAGCPHCNVTLTYHKAERSLRCHYCGYTMPVPALCPSCGRDDLQPRGFGTEKIEEELSGLFPSARIARLDSDTSRGVGSFERIVADFGAGRTDILVGTQMVTKGFDFGRVSLVGILNADNLLNYPDFRAVERAFQLMMQVAGRAGRRAEPGEVVIQTAQPGHPAIAHIRAGDYGAMARAQLAERRAFLYPPYYRLVGLTCRHRDKALLWRAAAELARLARPVFGRRLLGPDAPPVDRVRGEYIVTFLLKIEREQSLAEARRLLAAMIAQVNALPDFRYVSILPDVDPQ
ncbi:MAG: primosomal protein N' [Rikenellaceae bacterium]|nr:primosomal protein N' [Rikenellaceae bacterium]